MENSKQIRRYFYVVLIGASFLALNLLAPASGYALVYSQDLTFETSGQSMWSSGSSFQINYEDFWGVSWNESGSFGWFFLGTGAEVWAATNGQIGLDFGFTLDSGSVNVMYPVGVELIYPKKAEPGDMITISSQYTVDPDAFFATNFPEIQTYLDLVFDVYAGIGGKACGFGACVNGSVALDVNETFELLAFNRGDDGEFRLLGDDVAGFQFGDPYDFEYGDVTVWIPDIETKGTYSGSDTLSSEGESDLLQLTADIDKFATKALQTADIPVPDFEGDIAGFISYNLLDVHAGPDLDIKQQFSFDPDLMIRLDLGTGEFVEFPFGDRVTIEMPTYDLDLTPTFSVAGNTFTNDTLLGIGLAGYISALEASIDYIGGIGPLFEKDWGFDLFDIPIFSNDFSLLDFQDFTTETFTIEVVPEPGTLILLGIGLAGLGFMRRRNKKS